MTDTKRLPVIYAGYSIEYVPRVACLTCDKFRPDLDSIYDVCTDERGLSQPPRDGSGFCHLHTDREVNR